MADALLAVFGTRILRERQSRGWSTRDLASKSGVGISTISRIENARGDTWLSVAIRLAVALGIPFGDLVSTPVCGQCDGHPPPGFICATCGRGPDQ